MGANLPEHVANDDFYKTLNGAGLTRIHQGKVRDTYSIEGRDDILLLVATDRLSIFDFVLGGTVKDKGCVLTSLTVFWLTKVLEGVDNHLVAFGTKLRDYLPEALHNYSDLFKRGMIVKKLEMLPVECVVRGYLTGSGWGAYKKSGEVCGHNLAENLHDGSKLPQPIFTPTTKAEVGHDEHISFQSVRDEYGIWLEELTLKVYNMINDYSSKRGIILADTKFEFGKDGILADEVATPDSSRFWDKTEWEKAVKEQKSPSGYDKQPVREWGKTVETPFGTQGIHKLDTENGEHLNFVHNLPIPEDILTETTTRYRRIFELLTGQNLDQFQKETLGLE